MLEVVDDGAVAAVLAGGRHAGHVVGVAVAARVAGVADTPVERSQVGQTGSRRGHGDI